MSTENKQSRETLRDPVRDALASAVESKLKFECIRLGMAVDILSEILHKKSVEGFIEEKELCRERLREVDRKVDEAHIHIMMALADLRQYGGGENE